MESLRGASGISHDFVAAGADEDRGRLVVVSSEADASSAALAQADIQAALSDVQVVVARPVVIDLAALGRSIEERSGRPALTTGDLAQAQDIEQAEDKEAQQRINEEIAQVFAPLAQQVTNARAVGSINLMQGLGQLLEQVMKAKWQVPSGDPDSPIVDFSRLLAIEASETDAELGVCAVPIYGFEPAELEVIHSGTKSDEIEEILRRHGIFQYFFPAPDQTALALIDRGQRSLETIQDTAESAPEIGHPYGQTELVDQTMDVPTLIDALQERKLVVEGEVGYELTEDGRQQRATVRFKPREGFVSKLINRVSVKINLKSLFKIG